MWMLLNKRHRNLIFRQCGSRWRGCHSYQRLRVLRKAPLCNANEYLLRGSAYRQPIQCSFFRCQLHELVQVRWCSFFRPKAVTLWWFSLLCWALFFWRLRSSSMSSNSSFCLMIFMTRGAVTCCEFLYFVLAFLDRLDMPRPCWEGRSSIALSRPPVELCLVRFGIRCCRMQSSSGYSRSQILFMVRDRNVHLLIMLWVQHRLHGAVSWQSQTNVIAVRPEER